MKYNLAACGPEVHSTELDIPKSLVGNMTGIDAVSSLPAFRALQAISRRSVASDSLDNALMSSSTFELLKLPRFSSPPVRKCRPSAQDASPVVVVPLL